MAAKYQPSNPVPKGVGFSVQICLKDNANPGSFKAAPTIATGDFKCSGSSAAGSPGALTDMAIIPVVDPAGSIWVNVQFSTSEMNFDQVFFQGIDQTNPKEWADVAFSINTCSVTRGQAGTALPAAAADAAGGLAISDAGGLDLDLKIGNLPSVAAGASGGVVIAGSNAATTFAGLTTGALSCSTITASGAVAFQSTFAVTTSTSLAALSATTITASGAVAFQSTFAVTTSTSLAAISATTVTCSGAVALQSTLAVTGTTTLTGAVTAANASNNIVGIDVAKLGGVAQSLTDLKDFADTGYDPSTHKVQGVVLTDTVTTVSAVTGLTTATIAAAVEAAIMNEGDATALLAAIAAKVETFLINEGDATATLAAIGTAVWAAGTRTLTAGTNIVLAKGTGVTGFTDLSAAQVNAEVDTALADYDGPTNAEMVARTLPTASYFDPATDEVIANVKKVNDTTIDGSGTDIDPWGPV